MLWLIAILAVAGFTTNVLGLWSYSYFAPKKEAIRYQVFKEGQSYNDGMLRDLNDIRREYLKADPEQKAALRGIAIHRFDAYDVTRLPADLQAFYAQIQGEQQ